MSKFLELGVYFWMIIRAFLFSLQIVLEMRKETMAIAVKPTTDAQNITVIVIMMMNVKMV